MSDSQNSAAAIVASLKAKAEGSTDSSPHTEATAGERQFQEFKCSRKTNRVVDPNGRMLNFYDGRYITSEQSEIDYLKGEIERGSLPGFSVGDVLTSDDLDPMNAIRRKVLQEFAALDVDSMAAQLKRMKDFGSSDAGQNLATSATMANKLSALAQMLNAGSSEANKK